MPRRNSPNDFKVLEDLSRLSELVVDKRSGKRADARKGRRNRHYEKQFLKNAVTNGLAAQAIEPDDQAGL